MVDEGSGWLAQSTSTTPFQLAVGLFLFRLFLQGHRVDNGAPNLLVSNKHKLSKQTYNHKEVQ